MHSEFLFSPIFLLLRSLLCFPLPPKPGRVGTRVKSGDIQGFLLTNSTFPVHALLVWGTAYGLYQILNVIAFDDLKVEQLVCLALAICMGFAHAGISIPHCWLHDPEWSILTELTV